MNDHTPEDLEDLDRIMARAEETLAHVERLKAELERLAGHGQAADGQVRVTAGPSGRLIDVVLAPHALGMDPRRLAEAVLRAAQEAQDDVAGQVDEVLTGTRAATSGRARTRPPAAVLSAGTAPAVPPPGGCGRSTPRAPCAPW
ncbi:YbaB/EbfC family nucleoid-associated protein [Nonomuraea sp. NPDC004297]